MAINQLINFTLSARDEISASAAKSASAIRGLAVEFNKAGVNAGRLSDRLLIELFGSLSLLSETFLGQRSAIGAYQYALTTLITEISELGGASSSLSTSLGALGTAFTPLVAKIVPVTETIGGAFNRIPESTKTAIASAVNAIDGFLGTITTKLESQSVAIPAALDAISKPFAIFSSVREAKTLFDVLRGSVSNATFAVFNFTQELGLFGLGIQALQGLVTNGPFAALIGQNVQLREQLLATRTSLAATNKIIVDGQAVGDPKAAIAALEQPINAAIERIRERSLDLVGVTSSELVPLFQLVAQNAGSINADFNDMSDLAVGFAATMGTANIPLSYAGEEIRSILTGTADINTQMLRYLGLNNEQLRAWSAQGVLVDKLNERFSVFVEGNKTASQQFSGVTSNIKEIFEIASQTAGAGLLDSLNATLGNVYKNLQANREAITAWFVQLGSQGVSAFNSLTKAVQSLFVAIAPLGKTTIEFLFKVLADGAAALEVALSRTLTIITPFLSVLGGLLQAANPLNTVFSQLYFQFVLLSKGASLLFGSFNFVGGLVTGLGDIMFLFQQRSNPLFLTFAGLSQQVNANASAWLTFGTQLNKIPGALGAIANSMGPLGGVIAPLIPQLSQMGIGLVGLSNRFPVVKELMTKFSDDIPTLVGRLAPLASKAGLPTLSAELTKFASTGSLASKANTLLAESTAKFGAAIRAQIISLALSTAGILAAVYVFDQFIVKNKELLSYVQAFFAAFGDFGTALQNYVIGPAGIATAAIAGLALAFSTQLRIAIAEYIVSLLPKLEFAVLGASKAMLFLKGVVEALGFAQSAAAAQSASNTLILTAAAARNGALGFGLLTKSVVAFTASAAVAAAPLIALGAAIGLIAFTKKLADAKKANEELTVITQRGNEVFDDAYEVAVRLKAAQEEQNKADETGIALSKEQLAANQAIRKEAEGRLISLEAAIQLTKDTRDDQSSDEGKALYETQIQVLENLRQEMLEMTQDVRIANRELDKLGTGSQQNAKLIADAQKIIANPTDAAALTRGVEQMIGATQAQVEAGEISVNEAAKQLLKLTQIETLKVETQRKAKEAAIAIIKAEYEQRNATLDANAKVIESQQKAEVVSAQKATAQIAQLRTTQAQERLAAVRSQLKVEMDLQSEGTKALAKQRQDLYAKLADLETKAGTDPKASREDINTLKAQLKEIDGQISKSAGVRSQAIAKLLNEEKIAQAGITEAQASAIQARRALILEDFDERKALLEAEAALGQITQAQSIEEQYKNGQAKLDQQIKDIEEQRRKLSADDTQGFEALAAAEAKINVERLKSQGEYLNAKRALFEQEQSELLSIVELGEIQRNIAIQEIQNETVGQDEKFALQRVNSTRQVLEAQLKLERDNLANLQALPKLTDPIEQEKFEQKIRDSKIKTANLVLSLAKNEEEQQQALTRTLQAELDKRISQINNVATAQANALKEAEFFGNASSAALKTQGDLLSAQGGLQSALTGYLTTQYDILQRAARTESEKNRLAKEAAQAQKTLLIEQLRIDAERLRISQEQRRNELILQALRARGAQFEAIGKVAEARANLAKGQSDRNTTPEQLEALKLAGAAAQNQANLSGQSFDLIKGQLAKLGQIEALENRAQAFSQATQRDKADIAIASAGTPEEQRQAFSSLASGRSPASALTTLTPQRVQANIAAPTFALEQFLPRQLDSVLAQMNGLQASLGKIVAQLSENTAAIRSTANSNLAELNRQTKTLKTRRASAPTPAANLLSATGL